MHFVTPNFFYNYKANLDEILSNCTIPEDVLSCNNIFCDDHSEFIDSLHEHIVKSLITAAQHHIPFTQPYLEHSPTHPARVPALRKNTKK